MTVRDQRMHPEFAFELVIARDDLLDRLPLLHPTHVGFDPFETDFRGRGRD